ILIVILGGGFLLLEGRGLLFPFLFAIFFAFLLMPLESWIYRQIQKKWISISGSFLLVLGVIGGLSFIFGYQLIRIVSDMNAIQDQLKHGLEEILVFLDEHIPYFDLPADQESMNAMIGKLLEAPFRFA